MAKKKEEIIEEVAKVVEVKAITELAVDSGRSDINEIVAKINEIIRKINS